MSQSPPLRFFPPFPERTRSFALRTRSNRNKIPKVVTILSTLELVEQLLHAPDLRSAASCFADAVRALDGVESAAVVQGTACGREAPAGGCNSTLFPLPANGTTGAAWGWLRLDAPPRVVRRHGERLREWSRYAGPILQRVAEREDLRRRAEEAKRAARDERDRLALILENVVDPIIVTDGAGATVLMNREADRLFGDSVGSRAASHRQQWVQSNAERLAGKIRHCAKGSVPVHVCELEIHEPDSGVPFPVEVISGKILSEGGEVVAIVSAVRDLTKLIENERLATELAHLNDSLEDRIRTATVELERRNRQLQWHSGELERANRLKSEFLAAMSHELRTPINAVLGYTSLLRDSIYGPLVDRQVEVLERMNGAGQHLLELVNGVLDLAKIEAGKMQVSIAPTNVAALLRETSLTVEPMLAEKGLDLRLQIAPDLPPLETDATKLRQILLNLLSNACKFTHEGGICLSAAPTAGQGIEITVSDTGIGIPEGQLDTIFENFRQVDQSSTREYGGTGLGLSITRKLLELLGGTVRVRSSLGEGSVFTLWLPLHPLPASVEGPEPTVALR